MDEMCSELDSVQYISLREYARPRPYMSDHFLVDYLRQVIPGMSGNPICTDSAVKFGKT
jgi:hypothetical protein